MYCRHSGMWLRNVDTLLELLTVRGLGTGAVKRHGENGYYVANYSTPFCSPNRRFSVEIGILHCCRPSAVIYDVGHLR